MLPNFSARRTAILLVVLGACGESDIATAPAGASCTGLASHDIEAPSVFQVTEPGLWDGRPSFGGVWVAHPEVDIEQIGQVVIRNLKNGRFVTGALFRRERELPGPALQVSSEAAEALGMLAGAPAMLNVTALRRAEAAPPEATEIPTDAPMPSAAVPLPPTENPPAISPRSAGNPRPDPYVQPAAQAG